MTRSLLPTLLVVTLAISATWPALDNGFVYDDRQYVVENPVVHGEAALLTSPLGQPEQGLWRPLTVASWRLQWQPPFTPRPFLALNLALHAAIAVGVLLLGRRLGLPRLAALFGALLFAVHPVHAEALAWVSGRSELLATLFVLAAWLAHLSAGRRAWLALPLLALACLSKENALIAPALFGLTDLALTRHGTRPRRVPVARLVCLGALALALFALRGALLPSALPLHGPYRHVSLPGRLGLALTLCGQSLRLLLLPWPLRIHYDASEFLMPRPALLGLLSLAAAGSVLLWRRQRLAATLLLLVPVALFPVLNLIPIGEPFAERFLYLPSVPFCLAAGALLLGLSRLEHRGAGVSLLIAVAALGSAWPACRAAVAVFHDDLTLWSHAVAVAPRLAVAHYNQATFLERAGRFLTEDDDRPGEADALRRSLALDPGHPYAAWAHQTLGHLALGALGDGPTNALEAAQEYRSALAIDPDLPDARLDLAGIARARPDLVSVQEGLGALRPLLDLPGLDPDRRASLDQLLGELASMSSEASGGPEDREDAGMSSPAGS